MYSHLAPNEKVLFGTPLVWPPSWTLFLISSHLISFHRSSALTLALAPYSAELILLLSSAGLSNDKTARSSKMSDQPLNRKRSLIGLGHSFASIQNLGIGGAGEFSMIANGLIFNVN